MKDRFTDILAVIGLIAYMLLIQVIAYLLAQK